ncbi:MAG: SDR family oxidoreductase [Alphaproteobacteria bacterium]|nr:SDR family oxidoreductase [Alphaproteobacteria bacterium]
MTHLDPATLTVFVTGASSGFGRATAVRFAAAGSRVVVAARRLERLQTLVDEFGAERIHAVALDVRDRAAVEGVVSGLPAAFAEVDVLVNNAGLALGLEPVNETKLENWQTMIDTNINGLLYCTRALLPGMMERNRGHIINLSSIAGSYPYPGGNVYGGTKAFVRQFSLGLRSDLAGRNIRVTSLEPGKAETEFSLVRFGGDEARAAGVYEGYRPLVGEDVAECVYWVSVLPRHINVNSMEVRPLSQSFADFPIKPVRED